MNVMISKGFNGKISDIEELAPSRHRTSISRFLSNSSWNEKFLERALKTNRVIFPQGHERLGIKLHKFATSLDIKDFDLVTVKNKQYYIYTYIGKLKDRKNIAIVLSYPKDAFQKDGALKTFISLDKSLTQLNILTQYIDRWAIEPFFRDCKTYLGLDGYQVRSKKSINRYLTIMLVNYTYCKIYSNDYHHFNTGYKAAKKDLEKSKVIYIYEAAANGMPIEKIFKSLKIA